MKRWDLLICFIMKISQLQPRCRLFKDETRCNKHSEGSREDALRWFSWTSLTSHTDTCFFGHFLPSFLPFISSSFFVSPKPTSVITGNCTAQVLLEDALKLSLALSSPSSCLQLLRAGVSGEWHSGLPWLFKKMLITVLKSTSLKSIQLLFYHYD